MQVTLFKGLLPVNFPDTWISNPDLVLFANINGRQAIDFRPNGGNAYVFWVDHDGPTAIQRHEVMDAAAIAAADWGSTREHRFAVQGRQTVAMFGQSGKPLDLMDA